MTQEATEQLSKTLSLLEKETGRARKAASVAAERVGALASAIDPRRLGRSGSEDKDDKDGKDDQRQGRARQGRQGRRARTASTTRTARDQSKDEHDKGKSKSKK